MKPPPLEKNESSNSQAWNTHNCFFFFSRLGLFLLDQTTSEHKLHVEIRKNISTDFHYQ